MQQTSTRCDTLELPRFLFTPLQPSTHHVPSLRRRHSSLGRFRSLAFHNKLLVVTFLVVVLFLVTPTTHAATPTTKTTTIKKSTTIVKSTNSPGNNGSNTPLPTIPSNSTLSTIFILPTQAPAPNPSKDNSTMAPPLCPPPLIYNIYQSNSTTSTGGSSSPSSPFCLGPCCIPCPASSVFYEPHKLTNIYMLTSILRAISAGLSTVLAFCYLILPSRRQHPHLIVLCLVAFMAPWEAIGTIWLQKRESLLCKSPFEIATMSNSWLCGFQGIALMYLVLLLLCFGVLLIANLHFLSVYRSTWLQIHMTPMIVLSFFLPLALVVPVAARGQIENPGFGSICFVAARAASPFFFFPMAVIVCFATLLHLGTIAFMIRTKLKTNASSSVGDSATASKNSGTTGPTTISARQRRLQTAREISALLKQQWRPGLLALCLLFIDMIYWLFYFTEAKKLEKIGPTTPWFVNWIRCLGEQAILNLSQVGATTMTEQQKIQWMGEVAQRTCASIARPFVPSFSWAALSDTLPATFGCFLMIIFGTKVELWQDVAARLFRRPDANRPRRRFESPDARLERLENARRASPGGADGDQDLIEMSNGFDLYYHYRGSPSTRQTNPNGALDIRDFYTADGSWVEPESSRQEPQPDQPGQDDSTPLSETMHFGGKQPRKKSLRKKKSLLLSSAKLSLGSPSHPAPPSSLASPMSDSETLEGMIRKNSVSFADREPVYYRNPVKNGLGEGSTTSPVELGLSLDRQQSLFERRQNQAQMIIEGSAPWPSWPSSSFNTTTPSAAPLVMVPSSPPLAHLPPVPTGMAGAPKKLSPISTPPNSGEIPAGQPRSPLTTRIPSAPTSPVRPLHHHHVQRAQDLSSKGFYNSEDLAAPPIHLSQFTSSHVQKIVLGGSQPNSTNAAREEKLTVPIRASSRAQRFDRSPSSPVQGQGGFANPIMTVPGSSPLPPPPQQSPPLVPRKSIRRGKGPA